MFGHLQKYRILSSKNANKSRTIILWILQQTKTVVGARLKHQFRIFYENPSGNYSLKTKKPRAHTGDTE